MIASPSSPNSKPLGAGQVIARLLRDYVRGQWRLLAAGVLALLLLFIPERIPIR